MRQGKLLALEGAEDERPGILLGRISLRIWASELATSCSSRRRRRRSLQRGSCPAVERFVSRASLRWVCTSSTPRTASSRSIWRNGFSRRNCPTSSSCAWTTSTRHPRFAERIPEELGRQVLRRGLVQAEPVALFRSLAREDGDFDHHRADRDGRCAEHHLVADSARAGRRAVTSRSSRPWGPRRGG